MLVITLVEFVAIVAKGEMKARLNLKNLKKVVLKLVRLYKHPSQ